MIWALWDAFWAGLAPVVGLGFMAIALVVAVMEWPRLVESPVGRFAVAAAGATLFQSMQRDFPSDGGVATFIFVLVGIAVGIWTIMGAWEDLV